MKTGTCYNKAYNYPEYIGFNFQENYFPQISVCFTTTAEQGTLKALLHSELDKVYQECSCDDWAGNKKEKSLKISIDSYLHAKRFVEYLPDMISPAVIPYYNGKLGLEWNINNKILIAIIFNDENIFTYSILTDKENDYGKKSQTPEIQKEFILRIERLINNC